MKIQTKKQTVIARNVPPMRFIIAMFLSALLLAACGDDSENAGGTVEDGEVVAIVDKTISGVSQKGPFVNGSSVTVQELNGKTLAQTGLGFEGKIKNDLGEFSVKVNKLESQYALLKANGYYRNEVTGDKSKGQVTLYALTDLSNRDEVNVNLLTHLAYERSLYLATVDTLSVAKAKKQAEAEIFKSFGIEGNFAAAEDLNIFGADDQSAALLAVSILMQSDLSEGDFSERLADYAADIESDGIWNDAKTATEIADWASNRSLTGTLTAIRNNIAGWGLSADVPTFESYVNNFWWQNYGLGICDAKREGEVLKNQNTNSANADEYYICKANAWQVASDLEKDTYMWLDPTAKRTEKDGDVRFGDVVKTNCYVFEDKAWRSGDSSDCSFELRGCTALRQDTVGLGSDKVWHICDAKSWRKASTYEKDTFGWKDSTDGAIRKGNVTDSIYVFDKTSWRATSNVESKLGGCVNAIADSVGKVGTTYYICKSNKWVEASALEYDTYHWSAGKDGDSKVGGVNTNNCYVYENKAWRSGNKTDCSLNLRGCTTLRQDTVGLGSDKVWHICDTKSWRNATNIEKDTAAWGAGSFDGEVRAGQVNETVYYIYETSGNAWRKATTLEKDTYDFTNNKDWSAGVDGEIKEGSVTDSVYVYDATAWRVADEIEKVLGGCVVAIADSLVKVGSTYYICSPRKWVVATALQYDTYKKECLTDGSIVDGNVIPSNKYVCDDGIFRAASENDLRAELGCTSYTRGEYRILSGQYSYYKCETDGWAFTTEKLNQGTMTDERDGHVYKTIGIKTQMWMAENLNYADSTNYPSMLGRNWCMSDPDSCSKYGRYYSWSATIDSVYWKNRGKTCGYDEEICGLPSKVQGICPLGWHVPSTNEWLDLFDAVGGDYKALQAKGCAEWNEATDEYGFSALPAGDHLSGAFEANFWSSFSDYLIYADFWHIRANRARLGNNGDFFRYYKHSGLSVRCIKDEEEQKKSVRLGRFWFVNSFTPSSR